MKKINLIKLLSVLICAVIVFAACDSNPNADSTATTDTETEANTETNEEQTSGKETETETETETREPVEPILENFFGISAVKPWNEINSATRIDGKIVAASGDGNILVFRTADVDTKNKVTEKFTVYNIALKKAVLTVENKYQYSDQYNSFDWNSPIINAYSYYEDVFLPESVMDVKIVSRGSVDMILVSHAALEPIDKEIIKENDCNGCFYKTKLDYTYYDVAGNKISESENSYCIVDYANSSSSALVLDFYNGDTAVIDSNSMELISVSNAYKDLTLGNADFVNEKYAYFLDEALYQALGWSARYVEVYDRESKERVIRYYTEYSDDFDAFVLDNGNILMQFIYELDYESSEKSDFYVDEDRYGYKHQILDIKTGKVTDVELDYLIMYMLDSQTAAKGNDYMRKFGISLTDNVINLAQVLPIEDRQLQDAAQMIFVDNNMDVMYEMGLIIPEQKVNLPYGDFGYSVLPNGDYLVTLYDVVTNRAIVKRDGTVRTYLTSDVEIVGNYLIKDNAVYDYDMNLVCELGDGFNGFTFECAIGTRIIVSKEYVYTDPDTGYDEKRKKFRELKITDDAENLAELVDVFGSNTEEIDPRKTTESYIVTHDTETGKYSLYNAELELVLKTAGEMDIVSSGDGYIVVTEIVYDGNAITLLYTLD